MIEFKDVTVEYGKHRAVDGVSFKVRPHSFTVILGANGSGKSTLVSTINQTVKYTGFVEYSGESVALMPPRERAKNIAILPQVLSKVNVTVEELVGYGRTPYLDISKKLSSKDKEMVQKAIEDVGLERYRDTFVSRLSGGEMQKAYLAMILCQDARILVLDEPTSHMDVLFSAQFFSLLDELRKKRKKTVLIVTHDLALAARFADEVAIMQNGRLCYFGSKEECLERGEIEKIFSVKSHVVYQGEEKITLFSANC